MNRHRAGVLAAICATALATGCATDATRTAAPAAESGSAGAIDIANCGNEWSMQQRPQRVVVMKNTTPATLDALGVLDRVVAKAGAFPEGYYDAELNAKLTTLPSLSDQLDAGGHLQISREDVLAQAPDLVVGFNDTVNPQTMRSTGTVVVDEPALCGETARAVDFDDVYRHVDFYGEIFGQPDRARALNAQLRERLELVEPRGGGRRAVILYPSIGGGPMYAYGQYSMATTVASAAGLDTAFADTPERVFEVSSEQILAADPEVIIVVHSADDADAALQAVRQLPGLEATPAARDGKLIPMLLNQLDPPTPLAVDGLEALNGQL